MNHVFKKNKLPKQFLDKNFGRPYLKNKDILLYGNVDFKKYKNKKIFIIGGGPSSLSVSKKILKNYDFFWSCNEYYKAEFLQKKKIDLCLLSTTTDINQELLDRVKQDKTDIGFTLSKHLLENDKSLHINSSHKRFYQFAPLSARMGSVGQLIILATQLKASLIAFSGLDGPRAILSKKHAFANTKLPDDFSNKKEKELIGLYRKLYGIFLSELNTDIPLKHYGKNSKYCTYANII